MNIAYDNAAIEAHIYEALTGDAQKLALYFAVYLQALEITLERGTGYWTDKRYWMAKYDEKYICFILLNGHGSAAHKDEPEGWIIWLDDADSRQSQWYANTPLNDEMKETAWRHVDFCANCGSCGGGTRKTIFGKEFDNVCGTTFRFDNPNTEDIECAKKLAELRMAAK